MPELNDAELLRQYLDGDSGASQEAFSRLVERYIAIVYSAARRQSPDSATAEDVTQQVFIDLARKARTIRPGIVLSSWLLTATRYAAANARKLALRRAKHERKAAQMTHEIAHEILNP